LIGVLHSNVLRPSESIDSFSAFLADQNKGRIIHVAFIFKMIRQNIEKNKRKQKGLYNDIFIIHIGKALMKNEGTFVVSKFDQET